MFHSLGVILFFGLFGPTELTDEERQCVDREKRRIALMESARMYEEAQACVAVRNRGDTWRECDEITIEQALALQMRIIRDVSDHSFSQCF